MEVIAIIFAATAFAISFALTHLLCKSVAFLTMIDYPGKRSLHDHPVPRHGGLAILLPILIGIPIVVAGSSGSTHHLYAGGLGLVLIGAFSYWGDKRRLTPLPRLAVHFLTASLLLWGGLGVSSLTVPGVWTLPLGWAAPLFSLLFTAWFINLYNFMDGMDGFAGGQGVIGFAFLAATGWLVGHQQFIWVAVIIAAANLGYLVFNFPPARIFMGDTGSVPMGFLAAFMSLWGVRDEIFPLWVPVLIFSPFIVDATVTLLKRILRAEKFWRAHRSHYYQRLVLLGWSHRKTVLAEYVLMLGTGASAIALHAFGDERIALAGLAVWCVIFLALALIIRRLEGGKTGARS